MQKSEESRAAKKRNAIEIMLVNQAGKRLLSQPAKLAITVPPTKNCWF